jgi:hypothetical protein
LFLQRLVVTCTFCSTQRCLNRQPLLHQRFEKIPVLGFNARGLRQQATTVESTALVRIQGNRNLHHPQMPRTLLPHHQDHLAPGFHSFLAHDYRVPKSTTSNHSAQLEPAGLADVVVVDDVLRRRVRNDPKRPTEILKPYPGKRCCGGC